MSNDFVEGWAIAQTLGEGAFGEVQLVINKTTGEAVAMKVIDFKKHEEAKKTIRKEVTVHRMLSDKHIIQCYGMRQENDWGYIFLEYARGGELFDKIEPDIGMPVVEAQKYFKQLISGVEYMHRKGIAHRDLKPENLLLDVHDNLKISDFGMATIFRFGGQERPLEKQCGTFPYIAPEVLLRPYSAEPADIWSCGIILVAMLAGELPWDKPTSECAEYLLWKDSNQYVDHTPWSKIDNTALSLARRMLMPLPSSRFTIPKIKKHRWFSKKVCRSLGSHNSGFVSPPSKRLRSSEMSPTKCNKVEKFSSSQPLEHSHLAIYEHDGNNSVYDCNFSTAGFSFSQPTQLDDLLISTQLLSTQSCGSQPNSLQKLVRRMTRFFVSVTPEEAINYLTMALDKLMLPFKNNPPCGVTVTTSDRRKSPLVFKANILNMDGQTLVDFRLSKGCGLEFKKHFIMIKKCLNNIIIKGSSLVPVPYMNVVDEM
ncbi:serine/threonine-protein kinase grp isoform X1 [Lycorma delicatula]|uniref:serine/threonine-protein kinase grp isoform X1 n=1 Tax=Lycorma delicatula TaxID=130591 RepID=UPI003F514B90